MDTWTPGLFNWIVVVVVVVVVVGLMGLTV